MSTSSYPISYGYRGNSVIDRSQARKYYDLLQKVNGEQVGLLNLNFESDAEPMPYFTEEIVFKYSQPPDLDPTYFEDDYQKQEYLRPLQQYSNLYSVPENNVQDFRGNKVIPLKSTAPYNDMDVPYKQGAPSGIKKETFKVHKKEPKKTTIEKLFS